MMMCPHCGRILALPDNLTPWHDLAAGDRVCPGSRQIPRCAESDARWLWNGDPNPHFAGAASQENAT